MTQSTSSTPSAPPFDQRAAWQRLLKAVALANVACGIVLATLLVLAARDDWWRGLAAATLASLLAAAASLVPLAIGLRKGYYGVMAGFLGSSMTRFGVTIGAGALAVGIGGYPKVPTFMLVMPYYAATLAAEVWCLTRLQPPKA